MPALLPLSVSWVPQFPSKPQPMVPIKLSGTETDPVY